MVWYSSPSSSSRAKASSSPSSSSRAKAISSTASCLFFLLIIFQLPLFRVRCRSGICMTPVQITCSQLIATEILPVDIVRILLYPGAVVNAFFNGLSIASYADLFEFYNLTHVKQALAITDLKNLEILAGSYLSVAGSILGVIQQGRLSLFGMLLLLWGLAKEQLVSEQSPFSAHISPIIFFGLLAALLSVKCDVREVIRSFRARHSSIKANQLHDRLKRRRRNEREMKRLEWTVNYNSKTPRNTKVAQLNK